MVPKCRMGERWGNPGMDILTAGKEFVPTVRWWETGEAPLDGHTYPKEEFCVPLWWGLGQEWVGGMTGVRLHCKWRFSMS